MSNHKVKGGSRLEGDRSRRKEVTIELTSDESREFAEEEVVWAKVVGHPWWPAVVSEKSYPTYHFDEGSPRLKRKEVTYRVSFFGESSHAFLQESKIAEYLPNRDYFIELAGKQSKRCNMDTFRASVRQADIISNNPFEVEQAAPAVATPRKERGCVEDQRTGFKQISGESCQEKQKTTYKPTKNMSQVDKKRVDLPFQATASQKIMSQYVLRLLKYKNQSKYTSQTLKSAVIMAFKREKLFRKADQGQSENTLKWIKKISAMDIDEIIQSYCKKSDVSRILPIPSSPPQDRQTLKSSFTATTPLKYIYIDELGNQTTSSEPLRPYDFYIEL